jgi:MFS family permease
MLRRFNALSRDQRLMYVSSFLWGFGASLFWYIQPLYIESLGANAQQIGFVLAIGGLVVTFLYIPIGLWADRRGRKPVILAGWCLGAVATLAMALAPDWRWLIPAMVAYQLSNFAMPAYHGYVAASQHEGSVLRTFAILSSASAIGSILSPAVGGWIGELWGLRAVYLSAGVFFLLSSAALVPLSDQPASPTSVAGRGDARRLAVNGRFLWQIAFAFLLFLGIELGQVMAPKFLADVRGLSIGQIGWLGTVGSVGIIVLSLLFGQLRVERPWSLVLSQAVAIVASLILLTTPLMPFMMLAYFVHGSNRLIRPFMIGRLARSLDQATLSFGYGFYETAMRLGLAVAPYAAGLLYARAPALPLAVGALCVALTLALTFTLPAVRQVSQPVAAQLAADAGD